MLHIRGPDDDRNRKRKAKPEFVTEHRHGMARVTVMAAGRGRFPVPPVRVGGVFVMMLRREFHFPVFTLTRSQPQTRPRECSEDLLLPAKDPCRFDKDRRGRSFDNRKPRSALVVGQRVCLELSVEATLTEVRRRTTCVSFLRRVRRQLRVYLSVCDLGRLE